MLTFILCDFEHVARKSLMCNFPWARVLGCYFHLTQNLWLCVHTLALVSLYTLSRAFHSAVWQMMALAFLPLEDIPDVFSTLRGEFPGIGSMSVTALLDYFEKVYVLGKLSKFITRSLIMARHLPQFPPCF